MRAELIENASWSEFAELSDEQVILLLLTDEDRMRRAVARKTTASLPRKRVAKIHADYRANSDGIYYIVTHWLDLGMSVPQRTARRVVNNSRAESMGY